MQMPWGKKEAEASRKGEADANGTRLSLEEERGLSAHRTLAGKEPETPRGTVSAVTSTPDESHKKV